MRPALSDSLMLRLSEFLAAQVGLHFPQQRWGDLARGIQCLGNVAVSLSIEGGRR